MLPIAIGVALAVVLAWFARMTGFDRDRSYYAVVLIVIAAYYVLFACIADEAIVAEILVAFAFALVATIGALRWPFLLGVGIFMHGVFDIVHGSIISNSGVPSWWPAFCATIDMCLGLWAIYQARARAGRPNAPRYA